MPKQKTEKFFVPMSDKKRAEERRKLGHILHCGPPPVVVRGFVVLSGEVCFVTTTNTGDHRREGE
jgi:hypothetical protein